MIAPVHLEDIRLDAPTDVGAYLLTEAEIVEFATRWDPQPFHIDPRAAADSVFGELVACTAHLFSIISLLCARNPQQPALLAGLSGSGLKLRSPARVGDELHLWITYTSARASTSRPDAGVVEQHLQLIDADGRLVVEQSGAILVARRSVLSADAATA